MKKLATEIERGDRLPSTLGTFTVTGVEPGKRGRVKVLTKEETPEGFFVSFAAGEVVEVEDR